MTDTPPIYDLRLIPWTGGNEGAVLRWYRDPTGTPTIGYGFTWASKVFREWWLAKYGRKMRPGDTITKSDALFLLGKLIAEDYAPSVLKRVKSASGPVTPHAVAASIDMTYNCGAGALKWTWFKLLLAGKVGQAAARYRVTGTKSKGRRLPGLVRRRKEGAAILERNRWPDWVMTPASTKTKHIENVMPTWRLRTEDRLQGIVWLEELKFLKPGHRGNNGAVRDAVLAFQQQHSQLTNDGILGRATLDQIQRVVDLKAQTKKTSATGSAGVGAGVADKVAEVSGYSDAIFYGSLAVTVIVLGVLSWRYRDEIAIALKTMGKKL